MMKKNKRHIAVKKTGNLITEMDIQLADWHQFEQFFN